MKEMDVTIEGRQLRLTHLDRVYYPDSGLTKADLMDYYVKIAPYLLPHLQGRPITLQRFPQGITGESFYQKNAPEHTPPWIPRFPFLHHEKVTEYLLIQETAALIWLANQGTLEIHPWQSRVQDPQLPDTVVIDLDPDPPSGLNEAIALAQIIGKWLDQLGIRAYPKTSGATGIHIYLPIQPGPDYNQTKEFVGELGQALRSALPDLVTTERLTARRQGKVYVDHLQNGLGKTLAAPYSPRPLPGAPVSTPIAWDELEHLSTPHPFNMTNLPTRVQEQGDLFAGALEATQTLPQLSRI